MKISNFKLGLLASFLMAVLCMSQAVIAQGDCKRGGNGLSMEDRANHHTERMVEDLGLNEAQAAKIRSINLKYGKIKQERKEAMRAEKANNEDVDWESKKAEFEKYRTAHDAEIKAVLNPAQYEKHQAKMKERGKHWHHGKGHHSGGHGKHGHWKGAFKNEELRAEMKAYKSQNMWPVLKAQRAKLEKEISAEDKATIKELRVAMKELKAQKKQMHANGKDQVKEEDRASMRQTFRSHMKAASTLAQKYETPINALNEEIKNERATWHTDMKAIVNKHVPEGGEEGCKGKERAHKSHGKRSNKFTGENDFKSHRKMHKQVRFLLMDPNGTAEDFVKGEENNNTNNNTIRNTKLYPIPSQNSNTLEYTLSEAGTVQIDLLDKGGNLVRTISNEYKEAGTYSETVDIADLQQYHYYYQITLPNGKKEVQRFMKTK